MNEDQRIDLHVHSLFSDGELLPSEILQRAAALGYGAIAITDHADASNLEQIIDHLRRLIEFEQGCFPLHFAPGVELTHVPPTSIGRLAPWAKELGAQLVVVHGETLVEPVPPGTNAAAVRCPDVDVLAHPGLITPEDARLAKGNDIFLEITSRKGHSLSNGHVAKLARKAGASLVVNTDTHAPQDMLDQAHARQIAMAAGLTQKEIHAATVTNPQRAMARALKLENL
jgi:histidinol phosphatase-like PHP family hydrolase